MITRLQLQQYRRTTDRHRRSPENQRFRRELEAALAALPPVERRLIILRYCRRLSWVAVSMQLHYCERQVRRMDKTVCRKLEEGL